MDLIPPQSAAGASSARPYLALRGHCLVAIFFAAPHPQGEPSLPLQLSKAPRLDGATSSASCSSRRRATRTAPVCAAVGRLLRVAIALAPAAPENPPPPATARGNLNAAGSSHCSGGAGEPRGSLIISDEGSEASVSPYASPGYAGLAREPPRPVAAVTLALRHSLSPASSRVNLFESDREAGSGGGSCSGSWSAHGGGGSAGGSARSTTPMSPEVLKVIERDGSDLLPPSRRQSVFWIVQAACLFFTLTNVGLTEVLPVWLSTPPVSEPVEYRGTGGLAEFLIGNLQSTTGVSNIVLALFVTFRIINGLAPSSPSPSRSL